MKLWNTADKWLIRASLIFTEKRSGTASVFYTCVVVTWKNLYKRFLLQTLRKGYLYVTQWRYRQKEWKRQCSLFDNLSKSEHFFFDNAHYKLRQKLFWLWVNFEKKQLLTSQMGLFESISLASTNKLTPRGEKKQKLLLTFCIFDCLLKRWKNVLVRRNFE